MGTKVEQKLGLDTKSFIVHAIKDIVSDPDFGLELSESAKKRLRKEKVLNGKTVPFSEIKKKYY